MKHKIIPTHTKKNRSLWNIERILIRWMLFRLPQRPQNGKTILSITELLDQLLKQIFMVHLTVVAVFYYDNELRHWCFWRLPTSLNSNFLFFFLKIFIIKTTVMIWRVVQGAPCLLPRDSWCNSTEAAGPEEHLQGKTFYGFWSFPPATSKRLLKWVRMLQRTALVRKGSNPERGNMCTDIWY